ncbi:hypothetical protein P5673_017533 [Acropora cervicornis]|uniref:Uncharacterized protein n=1 Tax=Acropora cervicornis TaxID=6130 RepID=A0AAD9V416_ACRCE|nr:hypothetical protein P5673_017533 [Acropora cervicornis]
MRLSETSNKTEKCDVPEILETYFILVYFLPTGNKCEGIRFGFSLHFDGNEYPHSSKNFLSAHQNPKIHQRVELHEDPLAKNQGEKLHKIRRRGRHTDSNN